jgi:hypothetical protein
MAMFLRLRLAILSVWNKFRIADERHSPGRAGESDLRAKMAPDREEGQILRIERILCPVDFSEFSVRAYDYAHSVARQYEAKLFLQHVAEPVLTLYSGAYRKPLSTRSMHNRRSTFRSSFAISMRGLRVGAPNPKLPCTRAIPRIHSLVCGIRKNRCDRDEHTWAPRF